MLKSYFGLKFVWKIYQNEISSCTWNADDHDKTNYLLSKIYKIFSDGQRPSSEPHNCTQFSTNRSSSTPNEINTWSIMRSKGIKQETTNTTPLVSFTFTLNDKCWSGETTTHNTHILEIEMVWQHEASDVVLRDSSEEVSTQETARDYLPHSLCIRNTAGKQWLSLYTSISICWNFEYNVRINIELHHGIT